jgi:ribonuclease D
MSTTTHIPFELVTTAEALTGMTEFLTGADVIALDTEASSFHRFKERVCLVQVSGRGRTWLVDPLALPVLDPLGRLLADARMEVVIHDADYDLRILARHHGIRVENVFDTLVAADEIPRDPGGQEVPEGRLEQAPAPRAHVGICGR